MERGRAFGGMSEHFRAMAKRIVWLQKKRLSVPVGHVGPNYCDAEIDAIFWLLAQVQVDAKVDVESLLGGKQVGKAIDFKRYREMLDYVRSCRERTSPRMLAA